MALWLFLVTLALVCKDGSFSTKKDSLVKPSIILCRSPEQITFMCYWSYGDYHNLSSPGLLKLQYMKNNDLNWMDCPDNVSAGINSCFFNKSYTSVWVPYSLKLVGENVIFDEYHFSVDQIVQPDPPVGLNWTVLNNSLTGLHADILVSWKPPPSVDLSSGWLTLEYEVQMKEVGESQWTILDKVRNTFVSVYALKNGKEYLLRIRCRQLINENFGEFSEILQIQVQIFTEPEFPWLLFLIIALCGALLVLISFLFFKKKRIKMLILPPVPVPKIKGIDPMLLQKGKLDEVSSILACHDSYKPQLYNDDPWVEFIELDLDDPEEKNEGSDTDRLLGEEHIKSRGCLGVKDDDSGRASCCEPDIPETDFSNSDTCDGTSDLGQHQNVKENEADLLFLDEKTNSGSPTNAQLPNTEDVNTKPEDGKVRPVDVSENEPTSLPASAQLSKLSTKPSLDFYALVSDITPAGRLLLSPGQRMKNENEECSESANQNPANNNLDNAYICESAVSAFCAANIPIVGESKGQQSLNEDSYFTAESLTMAAMNSCPVEKASSYEMPVSDYTSVHIINSPQSLVLNTTVLADKDFLAPCGYMTPDQVNKVMQ